MLALTCGKIFAPEKTVSSCGPCLLQARILSKLVILDAEWINATWNLGSWDRIEMQMPSESSFVYLWEISTSLVWTFIRKFGQKFSRIQKNNQARKIRKILKLGFRQVSVILGVGRGRPKLLFWIDNSLINKFWKVTVFYVLVCCQMQWLSILLETGF